MNQPAQIVQGGLHCVHAQVLCEEVKGQNEFLFGRDISHVEIFPSVEMDVKAMCSTV